MKTSKDEYARAVLKKLEGLAENGDILISRIKRAIAGCGATTHTASGKEHSGDRAACVTEKILPVETQRRPEK